MAQVCCQPVGQLLGLPASRPHFLADDVRAIPWHQGRTTAFVVLSREIPSMPATTSAGTSTESVTSSCMARHAAILAAPFSSLLLDIYETLDLRTDLRSPYRCRCCRGARNDALVD